MKNSYRQVNVRIPIIDLIRVTLHIPIRVTLHILINQFNIKSVA